MKRTKRKDQKKVHVLEYEKQLTQLLGFNRQRKLSFFLGAGISTSCGLPDWKQLLDLLEKTLIDRGSIIKDDVADCARKCLGEEFNSIVADCLYGSEEVVINESILAIAHSGVNSIVCFNFDDLLEEAFSTELIKHDVVLNGEKFNLNNNHVTIFHPHGYLERLGTSSEFKESKIILSKSDYEQLYKDHYCLTNLIQLSILMTKTVLFVGMSMKDPNTIRLLKKAREVGVFNWHYALVRGFGKHAKDIEQETARLSDMGVIPVWYREHSDIPRIIREISLNTPLSFATKVKAVNKVLIEAIKELSGVINFSAGIGHPMDEARAYSMLKALNKHGINMEVKEVYESAHSNNWADLHAKDLAQLAGLVNDGGKVRVKLSVEYEWGNNLVKKLIDKHK
ncbi:DUF1889 family protein [Thiomicrospira pelophila]|uniref:DUF1889 family protein n=1 Tax=Thiomicrospira pelophila TaxID=934 RepID=UPI00138DFF65|nr:DUF1889 family protein [Thiomicrospira pelophila]